MNLLHCPKCGGELTVSTRYTLTYIKKMIYTDDGWDEFSNRICDDCTSNPVQTLGSADCNDCGKKWIRSFYEIGVNCSNSSVNLIELNSEERKMKYPERKKYFLEKGIKIIT